MARAVFLRSLTVHGTGFEAGENVHDVASFRSFVAADLRGRPGVLRGE
jgi:hypothetical protein